MTSQLLFVPFREAANAAFRVWAIRRNPKGGDAEKNETLSLIFVIFRDAANAAFRVWAFGETRRGANGELPRVELAR